MIAMHFMIILSQYFQDADGDKNKIFVFFIYFFWNKQKAVD